MTKKEYKESLEDKLDWDLLSQLHNATLQISGFCFKTKQIFLTVEIAVIGILLKLLNNKFNESIFLTAIIILIIFWFLDSTAYFYQVKIRGIMEDIRERILNRNIDLKHIVVAENSTNLIHVIENKRLDLTVYRKILNSFFNHSMWLYFLVFIINIVLWCLYHEGLL